MNQRRRTDALYVAGVLVGMAAFAWIVITLHSLAAQVQVANEARDQLARQVQGLGASPVAGPPGSRGLPGPSVTGPRGAVGPSGAQGSPGQAGATGRTGKDGAAGKDSTVPGPQGVAGSPGADSTVPGPQGPAGPAGKDGTDGSNGKDGRDGSNGQPPAGWTYTDPLGVTYTCSRVSSFDPSSPEYSCSPTSTPQQPSTPTAPASPAVSDRKRS